MYGYLLEVGWLRSARGKVSEARDGSPLPWYCYPSIAFLDSRVSDSLEIFEYGCGNSTLWWASRVKHVVSCEHNQSWYGRLLACVPDNVELRYQGLGTGGDYAKQASVDGPRYDVVVIDGRDRVSCAPYALAGLSPQGVIVWDNSDRGAYWKGFELLRQNGFRQLEFQGLGPVNLYPWETSIFYRDNNCLGI